MTTLQCEQWHIGENGASVVPWDVQKLVNHEGVVPEPPMPAYRAGLTSATYVMLTRDAVCPACRAVIDDHYTHPWNYYQDEQVQRIVAARDAGVISPEIAATTLKPLLGLDVNAEDNLPQSLRVLGTEVTFRYGADSYCGTVRNGRAATHLGQSTYVYQVRLALPPGYAGGAEIFRTAADGWQVYSLAVDKLDDR